MQSSFSREGGEHIVQAGRGWPLFRCGFTDWEAGSSEVAWISSVRSDMGRAPSETAGQRESSLLEEKNVWLRLMDLVVLPAKTLQMRIVSHHSFSCPFTAPSP